MRNELGLEHELGLLVERGEGLVHQEHLGVVGEGAGERHALLHPARELMRQRLLESHEADVADMPLGELAALAPRHAARLEPERHVVAHGHPRIDALFLEHHAVERAFARATVALVPPVGVAHDLDRSVAVRLEPGENAKKGRLAAARRADDAEEFARRISRSSPSSASTGRPRTANRLRSPRTKILVEFHDRGLRPLVLDQERTADACPGAWCPSPSRPPRRPIWRNRPIRRRWSTA